MIIYLIMDQNSIRECVKSDYPGAKFKLYARSPECDIWVAGTFKASGKTRAGLNYAVCCAVQNNGFHAGKVVCV